MNILRQLRWKLTLSYTLVTVSAFLVVTLIMGGILFSRIFIPENTISPAGLTEAVMKSSTPLWGHVLAQSPIDRELVRLLLRNSNGTISTDNLLRIGGVQFTVNTVITHRGLVIGADGILLGTSDPGYLPTIKVGEFFDITRVPGLEAPFNAALAGKTDPNLLYSIQGPSLTHVGPTNRFTFAFPVFGEDEQQVLGVIVVIVDSLPTQREIPTHLLSLAAKSVLVFLLGTGLMGAIFGAVFVNGLATRFRKLSAATDKWSEGDFSTFIDDTTGDEITRFAEHLNKMAKQLQNLLRRRQEMAVSEERNRLARDLHDSAKQQALAASFEVGTALTLFDRDPQGAKQHLIEADALVDTVRQELTNLVHELRPLSQDGQDFSEILREYAHEWSQRSGIALNMKIEGDGKLPLDAQEALYRITQEALANIDRHSSADCAEFNLVFDHEFVTISIKDNGCGFDTNAPYNGVGLNSMKERASALNGSFVIESGSDQGTQIIVTIPNVNKRD